jgi:hypothetical protein
MRITACFGWYANRARRRCSSHPCGVVAPDLGQAPWQACSAIHPPQAARARCPCESSHRPSCIAHVSTCTQARGQTTVGPCAERGTQAVHKRVSNGSGASTALLLWCVPRKREKKGVGACSEHGTVEHIEAVVPDCLGVQPCADELMGAHSTAPESCRVQRVESLLVAQLHVCTSLRASVITPCTKV